MSKPNQRWWIVMISWLFFTVLIGAAAPIIPQLISGPEANFGVFSVLAGGDLFIASAVIAADALGRFIRCFWLRNRRVEIWSTMGGVIASLSCLIVVSQYSVKVIEFRLSNQSTVIAPFALTSLLWFAVTMIGAGVIVNGAEAMPARS